MDLALVAHPEPEPEPVEEEPEEGEGEEGEEEEEEEEEDEWFLWFRLLMEAFIMLKRLITFNL